MSKMATVTKGLEWEYEQEYRLTEYFTTLKKRSDYNKLERTIELPSDSVTGVYIGMRMGKPESERIVSLLKAKEWSHVKIYGMARHPTKCELEPRPWENFRNLSEEELQGFLQYKRQAQNRKLQKEKG